MCGIGGLMRVDSSWSPEVCRDGLRRMGKSMKRRGPDAEGIAMFDNGGLLHRRLAIMDPTARSNQPMESSGWILSYNGEIYNFKSLRSELQGAFDFETTSDSEVLLAALEVWGIDKTISRIAGMFAFLAWNKRERALYAVRDHMGIKPLVFGRLEDGGIVFGSSVAAVREVDPDRWVTHDPGALGSFFTLGAPFTISTAFRGIERVPPAHIVRVDRDGSMKSRRYWSPRLRTDFSMEELVSITAEYGQADVPAALFMSGGVDSTFLACAIPDLDCFHLTSPEQKYAENAARIIDRKLVVVEPEFDSYRSDVAGVLGSHGEPLMSAGIPAAVSRAVSESGYKVAISANGADELFFGYPRTPMPEYEPPYLPFHETPSARWFRTQMAQIFRDSRNFDVPEISSSLPDTIELGMSLMLDFHLEGFPPSASYRWLELMTYVLHDLNPTLDAASMYHSLEVRVPFLDHRIVEGVLSWDASRLVTPCDGRKSPLKTHFRHRISPAFFQRPKLGFSIHGEQLEKISHEGPRALDSWRRAGRISVNTKSKFGDVPRDLAYLGSSCLAFDAWSSAHPGTDLVSGSGSDAAVSQPYPSTDAS